MAIFGSDRNICRQGVRDSLQTPYLRLDFEWLGCAGGSQSGVRIVHSGEVVIHLHWWGMKTMNNVQNNAAGPWLVWICTQVYEGSG